MRRTSLLIPYPDDGQPSFSHVPLATAVYKEKGLVDYVRSSPGREQSRRLLKGRGRTSNSPIAPSSSFIVKSFFVNLTRRSSFLMSDDKPAVEAMLTIRGLSAFLSSGRKTSVTSDQTSRPRHSQSCLSDDSRKGRKRRTLVAPVVRGEGVLDDADVKVRARDSYAGVPDQDVELQQ